MIAWPLQDNIIEFPQPQGKSNEWYTPARYIEAARAVMGGIDLDPASCAEANRTVKAARFYTAKENGLAQEWHGRVWLNPPYAQDKSQRNEKRSVVGRWVYKLLEHYQQGNIQQATLLTTFLINAQWFHPLWQFPICFVDKNVRFIVPNGSTSKGREGRMTDSHMFGSVFIYLGPHEQTFIDTFSRFGRIARAIDVPKAKPTPLSLWEGM